VLGDLVYLSKGDIVPADLRVFESSYCKVSKTAITGESDPIPVTTDVEEKDSVAEAQNMVLAPLYERCLF
jgi:P-type E1-E2 ATPase